jgi:Pyruvate/2-oxoacid:ferredoxin oxidoreductase delta subunit
VQIEKREVALDLSQTNQILMQAEKIALADCICRETLQNCDFPRNTCLLLNQRAENLVNGGRAKWITRQQAKDIVLETHKQALVHLAMYQLNNSSQIPSEICSCCSCCCQALQGLQRMNMKGLVESSDFVAVQDSAKCTQCGICVDRCHFGAITWEDDKLIFNRDFCFGCGLCVTACPENSIELHMRNQS